MTRNRGDHTCGQCGSRIPEAGSAGDETCVAAALEEILAARPSDYGYPAWECRREWTIPLVADCLESRYGLRVELLHLRRTLSGLGYDWHHRRWLRRVPPKPRFDLPESRS